MITTEAVGIGIRRANASDRATVAATISAAFFDDPVTRWLLPDAQRRLEIIEPMLALYADAYLPHGETYLTDDGNGAAVWLLPHAQLLTPEQEVTFGTALAELAGPAIERMVQLEETFAQYCTTPRSRYITASSWPRSRRSRARASDRRSSARCCGEPTARGCPRTTRPPRLGTERSTSGTATWIWASSPCPTTAPHCGGCGGSPDSREKASEQREAPDDAGQGPLVMVAGEV